MSSAPSSPQEDDVSRLFKSLDLAAFRFRSFERPSGDAGDGDGSEFQPSAGAAESSLDAAGTASPAPSIALPPAAPASLPPVAAVARPESPVDAAFSRLLRQNDPRSHRLPGFRLALPRPPRVVEQTNSASHDLTISDVLNRLYRLGGSKISLIRQRGEV